MDDIDLLNITWVAVDTETTGINPWEYEILEIGAVKFSLNSIVDRFQVLIKPEKKQDPKSKAIHNISEGEVEQYGINLSDALQRFYKFIGSSPLVFHNASFDLCFLLLATQQVDIPISNNYYYDTLYLLRTYKSELESLSLDYLRKYLGLGGTGHRALSDAETTSHVFRWVIMDNISKLNSNKSIKSFFRYHRKLNSFQVLLPRNLDSILSYFNKFIRSKSILKILYDKHSNNSDKNIKAVVPLDVMIFNQKLLLKCNVYPENYTTLIPLAEVTIFDGDRGPIKIANI